MIAALDETHDPGAASWVESANRGTSDFSIQNLPFGVFRPRNGSTAHIAVAIGDSVLDLDECATHGLLTKVRSSTIQACRSDSLNELMSLDASQRVALRKQIFRLLHRDLEPGARDLVAKILLDMVDTDLQLPVRIGDYTDFYAFVDHATNVGSMLRPNNALLPNYKWVPIGYHGRASSIVVSGTAIRRPHGQTMPDGATTPAFGLSRRLDYELEVGMYIAAGNRLGSPVPIAQAEERIFGLSLVNDWSARDIQSWEYQPLGPFLAKSFATTVSPWVVTLEALVPFRTPAALRPPGDPAPLPYLDDEIDRQRGGFDLTLEVSITTSQMREQNLPPFRLSHGSFREMYWTLAQLVTHHASNGCNLRPGDLLASGTVSGRAPDSRGCLLELTWKGERKIQLPTGEELGFLRDGDEITIRGWCEGAGKARIGFGECRGRIHS
jgi:fumarylacetoacetase